MDGTALDTLQVAEPASATAVPVGATWWETVQGLPARTVAGANVTYRMALTDAAGRSLAGAAERVPVFTSCDGVEDVALCEASQLPVGQHEVTDATLPRALVEVVSADEIVALELREHLADEPGVASEVLVVGIDRTGQPVRALPAVWTLRGHTLQDDPGDLLAYVHDDGAPLSQVTVQYGELSTSTWVHAGPEDLGIVHSDEALNCSATGSPAAAWLALGGVALLGLRRRSATDSAS
ncbi:MAG: hypothetical protein KTR31_01080 [Myxococcales bacterium]|nr:hypothetical protein [Myxococcales bacterium]